MKRGPKTTPNEHGDRLLPLGAPPKPGDFTPAQSSLWDELAGQLLSVGLLSPLYAVGFEALIRSWSEQQEAEREIAARGLMIQNGSQRIRNPALKIRDAAARRVLNLLIEFGLTPASGARVLRRTVRSVPTPDDQMSRMSRLTTELLDGG